MVKQEKVATCNIRRMTRQRRVILEELAKMNSHPTADEIYQRVRNRIPNISLGTVYRNLEVLTQCGIINKIETTGSHMRFDHVVENHYHIRCIKCQNLENVTGESPSSMEQAVREKSDYQVLGHRLEFLGICPRCREEQVPSESISYKQEE